MSVFAVRRNLTPVDAETLNPNPKDLKYPHLSTYGAVDSSRQRPKRRRQPRSILPNRSHYAG